MAILSDETFNYTVSDGTNAVLIGYTSSPSSPIGAVVIPQSFTNVNTPDIYNVVSIGNKAFKGTDNLGQNNIYISIISLTIPGSVTSIGESAFENCIGITSLTISNGVKIIGNQAFDGCTGITSLTIPNGVTSIGESAFVRCSGITSLTIPSSVTSISNNAFAGCTGITSLTIPSSVTSISNNAFANCTGITSLTIPDSVTSIGGAAFAFCTSITSLTIPSSVTSIGEYCFINCTAVSSIIFDNNSITAIAYTAFYGAGNDSTVIVLNYDHPYLKSYSNYLSGSTRIYNFGTGKFVYYGANASENTIIFGSLVSSKTYAITYDTVGQFNSGNQKTIIVNGVTSYTVSDLSPQTYFYKIAYGTTEDTYSISRNLNVSCFMGGTKILCQIDDLDKYIPVESITNDMLVKTYKHGYKKVIRTGYRGISCNYSKDIHNLYKLPKSDDVFEDLYITGGHSSLVDDLDEFQKEETLKIWNKLEKIDDKFLLLTVLNKAFTKHEITEPVNVYHIVLENDDINGAYGIYSNGLLTETMSQHFFDYCANFITVY